MAKERKLTTLAGIDVGDDLEYLWTNADGYHRFTVTRVTKTKARKGEPAEYTVGAWSEELRRSAEFRQYHIDAGRLRFPTAKDAKREEALRIIEALEKDLVDTQIKINEARAKLTRAKEVLR